MAKMARGAAAVRAPTGPSLESLLCHADAFGLTSATNLQRAICRAADGLPLGPLKHDVNVQWAFGGVAALPLLPVGVRPDELFVVAAVRGAKTLISSALAFRAALTCDFSGLRRGEVPRVSIMSLSLDQAKVAIEHLIAPLSTAAALRPFFVRAAGDTVLIRHPSGRHVEIKCVAGKKAGGSLVSRWSAGAIFDEAPRMQGQEDGIVNFDDMRKAVKARLLPGAQLVAIGSPWAPRGPVYDAVQDQWGKPSPSRVVVRGRGPMLNPSWWTPELIAKILAGPDGELIIQTDCEAEFGDLESQFLSAKDVSRATRSDGRVNLPFDREFTYAAFQDPATRGNAWTFCIVSKKSGVTAAESTYAVAYIREWIGSRSKPLKAAEVFGQMKPVLEEYGIQTVTTDRWSNDLIKEIGEAAGVEVLLDEASQQEKDKRYLDFKDMIVAEEPRISLPPHATFRADLLAVRKELMPGGGIRFKLPITNDGRHTDFAPSAVGALALAKAGPSWVHAMDKVAARGGDVFDVEKIDNPVGPRGPRRI
jgi:hypothetical protein